MQAVKLTARTFWLSRAALRSASQFQQLREFRSRPPRVRL